ncbi:ABC transporter substrate-binding protein [Streptomyces sp. NPDC008001]|uniref:ABC transporter substrate-binding protein n=1 Tax=Streptomyces sp. NPDC008001 TaxID=3364804 RepID=UPI0036E9EEB5
MNNAKMGAAVLGGYVLGRTKKAKLAIGLGTLLAGSRVRPGQLGKTLAQSPFLGNLNEQVRKELLTAGKAAATSVLTAKAEHLADSLHERTTGLREVEKGAEKAAEKAGKTAKKAPAARGSGHGSAAHSGGGTADAAHRTARSGGSGKRKETHEEDTHEKDTHSTARGRSSGGAHRTRRSDDG